MSAPPASAARGSPAAPPPEIATTGRELPLRLLFGSDAHSYATAKVEALRANVEAAALSAPATDFPAA
ncbi:hypothetical protein [Microbispora sp. KK1-11]|uniref:hypothetical protein n=1 Tax=Microbispora sp. KK1-11 TaxID=2053005 RepID=UPI001C8EDC4B|nr:hypothetical protein [Microbispora sp. KK1-11]